MMRGSTIPNPSTCSIGGYTMKIKPETMHSMYVWDENDLDRDIPPAITWLDVEIMAHLEAHYDVQMAMKEDEMPQLSPEIETFLKEMEKRFRQN